MPLTDVEKEIIRGVHGPYAGSVYDWQKVGGYKERAFNTFDPRGLMTTPKTTRACRMCRGNGWIYAIFKGHGNLVSQRHCTQCGGTGEVFG